MGDITQIRIQHAKTGATKVIPLKLWENGIKDDSDWRAYVAPELPVSFASPVIVEVGRPTAPKLLVPIRLVSKKLGKKKGK